MRHISLGFYQHLESVLRSKLHDVKLLLSDAQTIRTQWLTNAPYQQHKARQADTVQAAQSSVDGVLARRAKRAAEAKRISV